MISRYEYCYDQEREEEDVIAYISQDRDELMSAFLKRFRRFEGKMPSELVADIIFEICGWRIGNRDMHLGKRAYCDFSCNKILVNPKLKDMALHQRADPTAFKRVVLAHELGHIRLHHIEMKCLDMRSFTSPGQGYDSPRRKQREAEADLYAAIFCLPWDMLSLETNRNVPYLAKRFGITDNLVTRALAAYGRRQL